MAKPPGDVPIPPFNLPSGVALDIWTLLQTSATAQARFEEKLDQLRADQERANRENTVEQERARNQRTQIFDRFDEQREKIEKVDRRMDGVVRDVANIDRELTEEIKPELKTLREQRQHTAGAVWMLRTLWAVLGAFVLAIALYLLNKVLPGIALPHH